MRVVCVLSKEVTITASKCVSDCCVPLWYRLQVCNTIFSSSSSSSSSSYPPPTAFLPLLSLVPGPLCFPLEELREGLIRFGSMITAKDLNLLFKSIDREATGTISISNMEDMLVQTRNAVKADSESMWEGYVDCT